MGSITQEEMQCLFDTPHYQADVDNREELEAYYKATLQQAGKTATKEEKVFNKLLNHNLSLGFAERVNYKRLRQQAQAITELQEFELNFESNFNSNFNPNFRPS